MQNLINNDFFREGAFLFALLLLVSAIKVSVEGLALE